MSKESLLSIHQIFTIQAMSRQRNSLVGNLIKWKNFVTQLMDTEAEFCNDDSDDDDDDGDSWWWYYCFC